MNEDYKEVICPKCGYEQGVDVDDDVVLCDVCDYQYDVENY